MTLKQIFASSILVAASWGTFASADGSVFGQGWELQTESSTLQFQSIKNQYVIETSGFASFTGMISSEGAATLTVELESVDTKVDLRNVRMRFLFFETYEYPRAEIIARIDPNTLKDLETVRRKNVALPFLLNLHGVTQALNANLSVTLISDDLVAVSTAEPINISVDSFNLMEGLRKLQDTAGVTIVPSTSVSFDFIFKRMSDDAPSEPQVAAAPKPEEEVTPVSAALETEGDFSLEACAGRFEILSRTDDITFASGSARLRSSSFSLLDTVVDVVSRCPSLNVRIAGHTDSQGDRGYNQRLSEQRAASVMKYLTGKGIEEGRLNAVGFGEDQPVADNGTRRGRERNRRIQFSLADS